MAVDLPLLDPDDHDAHVGANAYLKNGDGLLGTWTRSDTPLPATTTSGFAGSLPRVEAGC